MHVRPFISICVRLTSDRERFRLSCDGFDEKLGKNKAPPYGDGGRTLCPFCGMTVLSLESKAVVLQVKLAGSCKI